MQLSRWVAASFAAAARRPAAPGGLVLAFALGLFLGILIHKLEAGLDNSAITGRSAQGVSLCRRRSGDQGADEPNDKDAQDSDMTRTIMVLPLRPLVEHNLIGRRLVRWRIFRKRLPGLGPVNQRGLVVPDTPHGEDVLDVGPIGRHDPRSDHELAGRIDRGAGEIEVGDAAGRAGVRARDQPMSSSSSNASVISIVPSARG